MNICKIPVRKGSERLAKKNYLKIDRFTVLEIALNKAIKSSMLARRKIQSVLYKSSEGMIKKNNKVIKPIATKINCLSAK